MYAGCVVRPSHRLDNRLSHSSSDDPCSSVQETRPAHVLSGLATASTEDCKNYCELYQVHMRDGIHCIPRRLIPTHTWTRTETRLNILAQARKPASPWTRQSRFASVRLPMLVAEEPLANFADLQVSKMAGTFYLILASASLTAVLVKCLHRDSFTSRSPL